MGAGACGDICPAIYLDQFIPTERIPETYNGTPSARDWAEAGCFSSVIGSFLICLDGSAFTLVSAADTVSLGISDSGFKTEVGAAGCGAGWGGASIVIDPDTDADPSALGGENFFSYIVW